jgi:hypothetical protein
MTPELIKGYICDKEDIFEWAGKNEFRYNSAIVQRWFIDFFYCSREPYAVHDLTLDIVLICIYISKMMLKLKQKSWVG